MKQYLALLQKIMDEGRDSPDRTGTGTTAIFGHQMRFDLQEGFPLLTTKKLNVNNIIGELVWFIRGDTNTKFLTDNNIPIWNEWADENGDLGPLYGYQWRAWPIVRKKLAVISGLAGIMDTPDTIDQLANVIEDLQTAPHSRRHIVSAWNVGQLDEMALAPCHLLFQFHVRKLTGTECIKHGKEYGLSCQLYQRSCDAFLGVPYNIASYAALTHLVADICGYVPVEFIWVGGDVHIYNNHIDQVNEQLGRLPTKLPTLSMSEDAAEKALDVDIEDFIISDYVAQPHIKGKVSV